MNFWGPRGPKQYTPDQIAKIHKDREKGMSYELLIAKYGGSKGSVYRALKKETA